MRSTRFRWTLSDPRFGGCERRGWRARVGVGFSAGGHLAGHAGLSGASSAETRIDLAMLGYAITSMEMETYRSARLILLGENAPPEAPGAKPRRMVTSAAPPFFVFFGIRAEDAMVRSSTAIALVGALAAYNIPPRAPRLFDGAA